MPNGGELGVACGGSGSRLSDNCVPPGQGADEMRSTALFGVYLLLESDAPYSSDNTIETIRADRLYISTLSLATQKAAGSHGCQNN